MVSNHTNFIDETRLHPKSSSYVPITTHFANIKLMEMCYLFVFRKPRKGWKGWKLGEAKATKAFQPADGRRYRKPNPKYK